MCPPAELELPLFLQLSGMVFFIVGFAYAWTYLPGPGNGEPTGGKVGKAHLLLGTIIMGLAGLQVGGADSIPSSQHVSFV